MSYRQKFNALLLEVLNSIRPYLQVGVDIPLEIEDTMEYRDHQRGVCIECRIESIRDGFVMVHKIEDGGEDLELTPIDITDFDLYDMITILENLKTSNFNPTNL